MAIDWNKPFEEWTDEEIREARGQMDQGDEGGGNKEVTMEMPDGTVLRAENHEALNRLMLAHMRQAPEKDDDDVAPEPKPQPEPTAREQFVMDKFAKKFMEDPAEALEYLDRSKYGFSSKQALGLAIQAITKTNERLETLETERFLENTPDYKPTQKNMKGLLGILKENNWDISYRNLRQAFAIGKDDGRLATQAVEKEEKNTPVPRTRSRVSDSSQSDNPLPADIIETAREMPLEKLEQFLRSQGALGGKR